MPLAPSPSPTSAQRGDHRTDEQRVRDAAPALLAALKALLNKAYKQNWTDAYPDQVKQAQTAIDLAEGVEEMAA